MKADLDFLRPYFLGPASENADVLESLLLEFLRDHSYWRRNFHPEDGQRIDPGARHSPEFHEFEASRRQLIGGAVRDVRGTRVAPHPIRQ